MKWKVFDPKRGRNVVGYFKDKFGRLISKVLQGRPISQEQSIQS